MNAPNEPNEPRTGSWPSVPTEEPTEAGAHEQVPAPEPTEPDAVEATELVAVEAIEPIAVEPTEPVEVQPLEPVAVESPEPVAETAAKPAEPVAAEPAPAESVSPTPTEPAPPAVAADSPPLAAPSWQSVTPTAVPLPLAVPPEVVTDADDVASEEVAEPDTMTQGSDEVTGSPEQPGRSPLVIAAVIAVVLALASSVLLAVVARSNAHRNAVKAARTAALAAARTETAATLTYDYRHLDADFAAAEKGLTPKFRAGYAQTTASSVVPLAQKTHAISTATIAASGVISAGADSAKILVYADQTVQNNLLKATSRLDRSVIEVSMVKRGGRWLIDNLQPF